MVRITIRVRRMAQSSLIRSHNDSSTVLGYHNHYSINLVLAGQAFTMLVPKAELTYGYFLTPEGAHARFWVLVCPFWVGLACLSTCCIVAVVLWWRARARSSVACMVPWWFTALLIFSPPSMYLDGQGNATIVI
jgi:hypothetical protein